MKNKKLQKELIKGVESNKIFTCGVSKDFESYDVGKLEGVTSS